MRPWPPGWSFLRRIIYVPWQWTWQNGGRFRRAAPGALPRLLGALRHMPGAGFLATLSNFQNLQIMSWRLSFLPPRAVEVPKKKGMKQKFQLKKYRKYFARSTACRRYLTRLSRKKDGAFLALLRRSRLPGVFGGQEPFLSLPLDETDNFLWLSHNFFLDTWNVICLFLLVLICYGGWK